MKRVSRWLMSLCIAALLAGTVGILPAKAADAAERYCVPGNYVAGANIAGFEKVANAMIAQGIF